MKPKDQCDFVKKMQTEFPFVQQGTDFFMVPILFATAAEVNDGGKD